MRAVQAVKLATSRLLLVTYSLDHLETDWLPLELPSAHVDQYVSMKQVQYLGSSKSPCDQGIIQEWRCQVSLRLQECRFIISCLVFFFSSQIMFIPFLLLCNSPWNLKFASCCTQFAIVAGLNVLIHGRRPDWVRQGYPECRSISDPGGTSGGADVALHCRSSTLRGGPGPTY